MKTFTEQIIEARKVSTPFVVLRTFDPFATCKAVAESFTEKDAIPFIVLGFYSRSSWFE